MGRNREREGKRERKRKKEREGGPERGKDRRGRDRARQPTPVGGGAVQRQDAICVAIACPEVKTWATDHHRHHLHLPLPRQEGLLGRPCDFSHSSSPVPGLGHASLRVLVSSQAPTRALPSVSSGPAGLVPVDASWGGRGGLDTPEEVKQYQ